ncbi:unnamed protein product [Didymodactylos carnosus]|uniref:BZIP domain-containing protein n=1 Tax=Didymodactylos carnosus TaxID=1234261 RepID=A0A813WM79_9BILA|nr:unnamed protein product [Didymodactylos carnosus]CAF1065661.1 unnamed protein product [Didymodactylos carnosus]CAF3643433.1 unnamed protein product [Didymodactylos carnosus]CAF3830733.1 unnamed protein product [Didymodactylos carnosus]
MDSIISSSDFPLIDDHVISCDLLGGFDLTMDNIPNSKLIYYNDTIDSSEQETAIKMMDELSPEFKSEFDELFDNIDIGLFEDSSSTNVNDLFPDFFSSSSPIDSTFPCSQIKCDVGTDPMTLTQQTEQQLPVSDISEPKQVNTITIPQLPTRTTKIIHLKRALTNEKANFVHIEPSSNNTSVRTYPSFIQISGLPSSKPTILISAKPAQTTQQTIPAGCYQLLLENNNKLQTGTIINEATTTTTLGEECNMGESEFFDTDFPMTPSTHSESADDRTTSPDITTNEYPTYISSTGTRRHQNALVKLSSSSNSFVSSTMLTDLGKLPSCGSLLLTDEELKLIKQEGYQIPTKLPLTKTEEKIMKKIRRKIKNKISAQESRRKKKEYVDTLERQVAKYMDENGILKDKLSSIEKNHRYKLQSLRSMVGKGTTTTGTVLMVLVLFFAVLFGIWSPITNKQEDFMRSSSSNSLSRSSNQDRSNSNGLVTQPTAKLLDHKDIKQEPSPATFSPYVANYKSRVLLSVSDEQQQERDDNKKYGPYLPNKYKYSSNVKQLHAPAHTYSHAIQKYMNKKLKTESVPSDADVVMNQTYSTNYHEKLPCLKRPLSSTHEPSVILTDNKIKFNTGVRPNHTSNYRINEKVVVIDLSDQMERFIGHNGTNLYGDAKPLKIIRVERTTPSTINDTLKNNHSA